MHSTLESILVVVIIAACSVAFLLVLNRLWPTEQRRQHNEIVGWQLAVVGAIYGVVIGFMLFAVWTNFEDARSNAGAEANALVNLSRIADGLPQAGKIQQLTIDYANAMVTREWPIMRKGGLGRESGRSTRSLWLALMQPEKLNSQQQITLGRAMAEMAVLTEHRRERQIQSQERMPGILWAVLIVGAVVTITSSCLYGTRSLALHVIQVVSLSALVGLSLVAIAQIDRPFQGACHVQPEAFVYAKQALKIDRASKLF